MQKSQRRDASVTASSGIGKRPYRCLLGTVLVDRYQAVCVEGKRRQAQLPNFNDHTAYLPETAPEGRGLSP
jgi:hypothetical protein